MLSEYKIAKAKYDEAHPSPDSISLFDKHDFLDIHQHKFFKISRKSIHVNRDITLDEERFIKPDELISFRIDDIIKVNYISARRSVDNRDVDHTLSNHTSKLHKIQKITKKM